MVLGLSPLQPGWWSLPSAAGFIVGSNLAPRFVHRVRPATILAPARLTAALGLGALAQADAASSSAVVVAASVVISLAFGAGVP